MSSYSTPSTDNEPKESNDMNDTISDSDVELYEWLVDAGYTSCAAKLLLGSETVQRVWENSTPAERERKPLVVTHPPRPIATGQVIERPKSDDTYLHSYVQLDRAPLAGEIVDVVSIIPSYKRDSYGPPTLVGLEARSAGEGKLVWRVVLSPWLARRNAAHVNHLDMDTFEHSFRVSAFDVETGEPVNRTFDVKCYLTRAAEQSARDAIVESNAWTI